MTCSLHYKLLSLPCTVKSGQFSEFMESKISEVYLLDLACDRIRLWQLGVTAGDKIDACHILGFNQ